MNDKQPCKNCGKVHESADNTPASRIVITSHDGSQRIIESNQFIILYPEGKGVSVVAQASLEFIHEEAAPAFVKFQHKQIMDVVDGNLPAYLKDFISELFH